MKRYSSFDDIPQFPFSRYAVDVSWVYLEQFIAGEAEGGLDLDPDFQRGHVWTRQQQVSFVEFKLRGGRSGGDLFFNCPGYFSTFEQGAYSIVDGKQRLEAVRAFMRDELPAFGTLRSGYRGALRIANATSFRWHVLELDRLDTLRWYLAFNDGGVVHSTDELARVRDMLSTEEARHA